MLFAFTGFVAAAALTKHISAGSIVAAVILPLASFYFGEARPLCAMAAAVSALILYKHIPNMARLASGRELLFDPEPQGTQKTGRTEKQEEIRQKI